MSSVLFLFHSDYTDVQANGALISLTVCDAYRYFAGRIIQIIYYYCSYWLRAADQDSQLSDRLFDCLVDWLIILKTCIFFIAIYAFHLIISVIVNIIVCLPVCTFCIGPRICLLILFVEEKFSSVKRLYTSSIGLYATHFMHHLAYVRFHYLHDGLLQRDQLIIRITLKILLLLRIYQVAQKVSYY